MDYPSMLIGAGAALVSVVVVSLFGSSKTRTEKEYQEVNNQSIDLKGRIEKMNQEIHQQQEVIKSNIERVTELTEQVRSHLEKNTQMQADLVEAGKVNAELAELASMSEEMLKKVEAKEADLVKQVNDLKAYQEELIGDIDHHAATNRSLNEAHDDLKRELENKESVIADLEHNEKVLASKLSNIQQMLG